MMPRMKRVLGRSGFVLGYHAQTMRERERERDREREAEKHQSIESTKKKKKMKRYVCMNNA